MKHFLRLSFTPRYMLYVASGIILYWGLFILLHEYLSMPHVPIVILPVVASCWFWGTKRGLLAGTFIILSSLFFVLIFHIHNVSFSGGLTAIAMSFVLGGFSGWVRKLYEREKKYSIMLAEERKSLLKEIDERKKAEDRALWDEYFLKTMSNSSPLGILAINNNTDEVLYCNHRFCEIWNVETFEQEAAIKTIKSSEFIKLCHKNLKNFESYQKYFSPLLDLKGLDTTTIDIEFKDGRIIRRFTSPIKGNKDEYFGRLFIYEDVTARTKSEQLLKRVYQYEHLIYTISNLLVKVPAEKIDEAFNAALKEAGEFLKMDLGYFYKADPGMNRAENLYEWRSSRDSLNIPRISILESALLPSFKDKLLKYENIIVSDIERLPPGELKEKEYLLSRGIKAVAVFPVVFNNTPIGFLGFSSQSPKQFPEDAISTFRIISDILGGAFMRKAKTDELLTSEERFRLLVQHSADMITVADGNGNLQYVSEACGRIMGYKPGELSGMSIMEHTHPDDVPKLTGIIKMLLRNKLSASGPHYIRVRHKNGSYVYLESIFTNQLDNPALSGIVINSRDFTQHLVLQEALRNSRNFLNAVINSASDPMFVKDSSYKWVLVNDAFAKLTGYKREEMLGKTAYELFPKEEADNFSVMNSMALQTGNMEDCDISFTDAMGKKHDIVSHLSTYHEESGERFLIANLRDETKRKELEREINNALMREKELNKLKSKFVSMVSHEYRTPLTAILSSAELIELFGLDMEESEKLGYLNNIKNSVDYLTSLLDDVLLINRSESGRMQFDPGQFELISFIREILLGVMDGLKCRVEFETVFDSKTVFMDKKLLRHILMNLLSNAIKYSAEGATVRLKISSPGGSSINFEVEDKGIGIPPEDREHLFEPFFRADNVSNIPGSGLGLSIVKNCVDLHMGSISFESSLGEGTCFTVSLPVEG